MTIKLESGGPGAIQLSPIGLHKTIENLPQELREQIFSILSKEDLQAAALVNRKISSSAIETANFNEPVQIKNFIKVLIGQLNSEIFPIQIGALSEISRHVTSQNFENLLLLKRYILSVKTELINVIKTLDKETVNNLKDHVILPHFFENIFELVTLEMEIDLANLIPDEFEKGQKLWSICKNLTEKSNVDRDVIDRVILVAPSIYDGMSRAETLWYSYEALTRRGDIDRAIDLASQSPDLWDREEAFRCISTVLAQAGDIDRAIDVAISISNETTRSEALWNISRTLRVAGDIDRAIDVAESIPSEVKRSNALGDISQALMLTGNIKRALDVAESIPIEWMKKVVCESVNTGKIIF